MSQLAMDTVALPSEHRSFPKLTAEQKRAVNEVWDEVVNPALEEVNLMKRQVTTARLEAQDHREALRRLEHDHAQLLWATRAGA